MKIAIAIATAGRREGLSETVAWLRQQTRMADALYICPAGDDDLDLACLENFPCKTHVVRGARGLPAQRNLILRAMKREDVAVFFDDDFLPEPDFLKELEGLMERNPGIIIATGHVIADGARGPGIDFDEGKRILESLPPLDGEILWDTFGGYGCNMAMRMRVVRQTRTEFDETLPLYAWWEDIDFSRRLAPFGKIMQSFRLRGVHLGSKKGRSPGKKLGYSQVSNILYMARKGSIPVRVAITQISKNLLANFARTAWPEPWVDRKGRLWGNLLALKDAMVGKINPQEILKF